MATPLLDQSFDVSVRGKCERLAAWLKNFGDLHVARRSIYESFIHEEILYTRFLIWAFPVWPNKTKRTAKCGTCDGIKRHSPTSHESKRSPIGECRLNSLVNDVFA
jgi:hypothetical protein